MKILKTHAMDNSEHRINNLCNSEQKEMIGEKHLNAAGGETKQLIGVKSG